MNVESKRIQFLVDRDGMPAAKEQVAEKLRIYYLAVNSRKQHASSREARGGFVDSLLAFAEFVGEARTREVLELAESENPMQHLESLRTHPADVMKPTSNVLQAAQMRIRSLQHS